MGYTLTEKILMKAGNLQKITSGQVVWANVDILMSHDPCAPGIISVMKREFGEDSKVWNKDKFIMIPDHFIYTIDPQANDNIKVMREFAKEQSISHFYDVSTIDYKGVCHIGLAEGGHNIPGQVLVGTDSHTVTSGAFGTFSIGVGITDAAFVLGTGKIALRVPETISIRVNGKIPKGVLAKDIILYILGVITVNGGTYKALEFSGDTFDNMSVEERMTVCNMAIECGAKNGIMSPNFAVFEYLRGKNIYIEPDSSMYPDSNAKYSKIIDINVESLVPALAKPHSPDNYDTVENLRNLPIHQAYIGSCTGGKTEDFISAAEILYGNNVQVPTFAVPATKEVFFNLITKTYKNKSIFQILIDAGVNVTSEPSCAACCGGPIDTFGRVNDAINVISTTNRNFVGRMGNKNAQIYLASPYTVAASAIVGRIEDPRSFLN